MSLLKISSSAASLILAIIIIRTLLLHQLSKKTFLTLWKVALCRLLLPFSIPSKFSIYSAINALITRFQEVGSPLMGTPTALRTTVLSEAAPNISQSSYVNPNPLLVIWLIGFITCVLFFFITHLRCRKEYQTSIAVDNELVNLWLQNHPLRRRLQIRHSDRICAPLTYGIFRPVILLPKQTDWTDEVQLHYILTHEFVHIRRFDTLLKLIMAITISIHWFNPFVWLLYVLANRDIELSCDEAVIHTFGRDAKSTYALTLIGLEETKNRFMPLVSNFSKNAIEERIVSIMKIKKTSLVGGVLALTLIAGAIIIFATNASPTPPTSVAIADSQQSTEYSPPDFSEYQKYGLTYDSQANKLTYLGQTVRYFEDFYSVGEESQAGIDFFNKDGTIDVHTLRDLTPLKNPDGSTNPAGKIISLDQSSQKDFDSRNISNLLNPAQTRITASEESNDVEYPQIPAEQSPVVVTDATSEAMMTPDELAKFYAEYAPFNLTYNKKEDRLYYNGKLVLEFMDILSSNGESLEGGKFSGSMRNWNNPDNKGEVSVKTVRDYTTPNAYGEGKLLKIVPME